MASLKDLLNDEVKLEAVRLAFPAFNELLQALLEEYSIKHIDDLKRLGMATAVVHEIKANLEIAAGFKAVEIPDRKPKHPKLRT